MVTTSELQLTLGTTPLPLRREGKLERRRREQISRVQQWQAWLDAGMPLGQIPVVPRDCDFKAYRQSQTQRGATG